MKRTTERYTMHDLYRICYINTFHSLFVRKTHCISNCDLSLRLHYRRHPTKVRFAVSRIIIVYNIQ